MGKNNVAITISNKSGNEINIFIPWEDGAKVDVKQEKIKPKRDFGFGIDSIFGTKKELLDEGLLYDDLT